MEMCLAVEEAWLRQPEATLLPQGTLRIRETLRLGPHLSQLGPVPEQV